MTENEAALLLLFLLAMVFVFGCLQIGLSKLWRRYVEKETPAKDRIQHSTEFLADQVILLNHSLAARDELQRWFAPIPDDVREAWRRCVDAIIDGREQANESELLSLKIKISTLPFSNKHPSTVLNMSSLLRQRNWEDEDQERFVQLCELYDKVKKQNTKLKIKCPFCNRSLKGVTEAMIGDTAVCPKCKSEFTIEKKSNEIRDNSEK